MYSLTQSSFLPHYETVKLGRVIEDVIQSVSSLVSAQQRKFTYKIQPDLFSRIDKNRIKQCLSSVLNNAIKHTVAGGKIQVNLHQIDSMAVIDIIDNGVGISASSLTTIFETSANTDQNLIDEEVESQLNLANVKELIHMHGGYVTAMSDGLDQGSHIEICLPLADEVSSDNIDSNESNISTAIVTPIRLLIVDDNVDTADSLALLLQLKGHETAAVYNARDAIEAVKNFSADIILLDIGLPDMSGYDLARELIAQGVTSKLIALTGYGQPEDIQRALDAGFSTHATKPVNVEELEYVFKKYY